MIDVVTIGLLPLGLLDVDFEYGELNCEQFYSLLLLLPHCHSTLSFPIGTSLSDISESMKCGAEDMLHMVYDDI